MWRLRELSRVLSQEASRPARTDLERRVMRTFFFWILFTVSAAAWADGVQFLVEPASRLAPVGAPAGVRQMFLPLTPAQKRLGLVFQGQLLGKQAGLDRFCREMALSEEELAAVLKGMAQAARGEELSFAIAPLIGPVQEHFDRRVAARKASAPAGEKGAARAAAEVPAAAPAGVAGQPAAGVELPVEQQRQGLVLQGFFAGKQVGIPVFAREMGLDAAELAAVLEGVLAAARGGEPAEEIAPLIDRLGAYFDERAAPRRRAWQEENRALLARLDADATVTRNPSGLRYRVLADGGAERPTGRSIVQVRFTGRLCDGTVFDSSYSKRGDKPIEFAMATAALGWHQGLQLIGKGGKIRLWIPPMLAFGPQAQGPIPAGSVLEFEAELVDFR